MKKKVGSSLRFYEAAARLYTEQIPGLLLGAIADHCALWQMCSAIS